MFASCTTEGADMGELDEFADALARARDLRRRQLGTPAPKCGSCGEGDPLALSGVSPTLRCYECLAIEQGRRAVEAHHVAGRANDPSDTVGLPGNDHRVVSALQARWDAKTLRNPDGSPLLQAAAGIRGWLDVLVVILDRSVGWVPAFLEWLDAALRLKIGPAWWCDLGWEG